MPENTDIVSNYAHEILQTRLTGQAKEHAYRPELKQLMSSFENVSAVNDPKRSDFGNPDFVFVQKSNTDIILGYAETKDVDIDLDKIIDSDQLRRYAGYKKLFLTNYLEFRFYENGEEYERVRIGELQGNRLLFDVNSFGHLSDELQAFIERPPERIKSGIRLATIMGGKARRMRDNVRQYLNDKTSEKNKELERIYTIMKKLLVHDLAEDKFADMYAQTLVYGLFVARYNDPDKTTFNRIKARELVPASNPFLKEFFDHIVGPHFDIRLAHIVDELCDVFNVSDVHRIIEKHLRLFEVENDKDPIIHFYEEFLAEYNPTERKKMGAYYTPVPIVRFIVRNVDRMLNDEFDLAKGLADDSKKIIEIERGQELHIRNAVTGRMEKTSKRREEVHRVQILDPAVGTATFLNEVLLYIHNKFGGQEGRWPTYAKEDLLPRLYGFELMMAPYTIAHLKLGMTLSDLNVTDIKDRLGIYLTNTLEEGIKPQIDIFAQIGLMGAVTHESEEAAKIKHERPIMVIVGNPPYSGISSNETEYANSLVRKYKVEPGGKMKLQERKHWLNDDYVKFIAFAEDMISKNGEGIVAMITNNGYLDNPTFRGMRWHLCETFDKIFILDLHGNSKKKEKTPSGDKDENVFNIQQGVGIILAVKTGKGLSTKPAEVYHAEIYGNRKYKFAALSKEVNWQRISLDTKNFYFIPKNIEGQSEYETFISVDDLFVQSSVGAVTGKDKVVVNIDKRQLEKNIDYLIDHNDQEIRQEFSLRQEDARDWTVATAQKDAIEHYSPDSFQKLYYRPFDKRWTFYTGNSRGVYASPQSKIMRNFINHRNIGLLTIRRSRSPLNWNFALVTDSISNGATATTALDINYCFPLYIFHDDGEKSSNFNPSTLKIFTQNLKNKFEPVELFDFVYAVLYSPKYQKKYSEFLKMDFPRVPAPKDDSEFKALAEHGKRLRELHLMHSAEPANTNVSFPQPGGNIVDQIKFENEKVWINSSQYFGNVPEAAWNFYIGGYQPAQKWLKDRKGKPLTNQDIEHYEKIIKILVETDNLMQEIDKTWQP